MKQAGQTVFKRLTVRVILPAGQKEMRRTFKAPGQHFTEHHIDATLTKIVNVIEAEFPDYEFRMIEVSKNQFNFVYQGQKQPPAEPTAPFPAS